MPNLGWRFVLCCLMQQQIEITRLIADLQARSIVHHYIIMQLVRSNARETDNPRAYLSGLAEELTQIVDQSLPLDDVRTAAMSMRQYFDEFLVNVGADLLIKQQSDKS